MKKTDFLQIRVTPSEKKILQTHAKKKNMDVTSWVKSRLFHSKQQQFQIILSEIESAEQPREAWAELHDFLTQLSKNEFLSALFDLPRSFQNTFKGNYIAAMIETTAQHKNFSFPAWTKHYMGLETPYFGSTMDSLRLHLLVSSPAPFRKRNIFIDTSIGGRI